MLSVEIYILPYRFILIVICRETYTISIQQQDAVSVIERIFENGRNDIHLLVCQLGSRDLNLILLIVVVERSNLIPFALELQQA